MDAQQVLARYGVKLLLMLVGGRSEYIVGVNLGKKQDYTAVTVVERSEVVYGERDPVTYGRR